MISAIPKENLVYIDESGIEMSIMQKHCLLIKLQRHIKYKEEKMLIFINFYTL
ncbi:hypothetical protein [Orientia tsutsugamushi]|uniref:hypothetical protein n=1 Tax=Orientia tsutsugamushi TaxID=784 RepID=UPI002159FA50|nr:hypothetical protein [Orientia tsutsugamushi]